MSGQSKITPIHLTRLRWLLFRELPIIVGPLTSVAILYLPFSFALITSVLLLTLAVFCTSHVIEHSLVYPRDQPHHSRSLCISPTKLDFTFWERISLYPDGRNGPKLAAYLLLQDPSTRPFSSTILFLHGNAGNIGHRLPICRLLFESLRCNILIFDYRGYGLSSGTPSEYGLYSDVEASMDYLWNHKDINREKIFVYGNSLGGALAVYLATSSSANRIRGVIVENSFTSLPEAAQSIFTSTLGKAVKYVMTDWMFINRYPSLDRIKQSYGRRARACFPPILFISGTKDDLIPPSMMDALVGAYRDSDTCEGATSDNRSSVKSYLDDGTDGLVEFPGGHNDTWLCEGWTTVLQRFFAFANTKLREDIV